MHVNKEEVCSLSLILMLFLTLAPIYPKINAYGLVVIDSTLIPPDRFPETSYLQVGEEYSQVRDIGILAAWGKTTISVVVRSSGDTRLDEAVIEGMSWWSRSIPVFTALYGYEYLEELRITITTGSDAGDIIVRFVDSLGGRVCGQASYWYTGARMIERAEIRLSRSCFREIGIEGAKVTAAHELGHALGLDHSANREDVMYEFIIEQARPSTLDLFGLAKAYEWIKYGSFRSPPTSATLPPDIPYIYLLDEDGNPIKLVIRVLREIDGNVVGEVEKLSITAGERVSIIADKIIQLSDVERLFFKGWYANGKLISNLTNLEIKPKGHLTLIQRYVTQYWVSIETIYGEDVEGWFDKGSMIEVNLPDFIIIGNGSRLVFTGWRGINISKNILIIQVNGSIRAEAVWGLQYRVWVVTDIGQVLGDGWYYEGELASVSITPNSVEFGNGSRLILRGFNIEEKFIEGVNITFRVNRPTVVKAVWGMQYLLLIEYSHAYSTKLIWVNRGETITIKAEQDVELANKTRISFLKWTGYISSTDTSIEITVNNPMRIKALYSVYYLVEVDSDYPVNAPSGWVRRGDEIMIEAPDVYVVRNGTRAIFVKWTGDIDNSSRKATLSVSKPVSVKAIWRVEHLVSVKYPSPIGDMEKWVADGDVIILRAEPLIELSPRNRLEFAGWEGDVDSQNPEMEIRITRPMSIVAVYRELVLTKVLTSPPANVEIMLVAPSGSEVSVRSGREVWMERGRWRVLNVDWRGVDVKSTEEVVVDDYTLLIPIRLYNVSIAAVDVLGIPAPMVDVELKREDGFVEGKGKTDLTGAVKIGPVSDEAVIVEVKGATIPTRYIIERPSDGSVAIKVPVSLYTLTILTSVLVILISTAVAYTRRKHRFLSYSRFPARLRRFP